MRVVSVYRVIDITDEDILLSDLLRYGQGSAVLVERNILIDKLSIQRGDIIRATIHADDKPETWFWHFEDVTKITINL